MVSGGLKPPLSCLYLQERDEEDDRWQGVTGAFKYVARAFVFPVQLALFIYYVSLLLC